MIDNELSENEKTEYEKLIENPTVKNWLVEISSEPRTRRSYAYHLLVYTKFLNMSPEELLREAEDEMFKRVKIRNSKLNEHLNSYKEYMRNKFAPKTVKSRMTAIHSFYKYHDIPLPPKMKKEKRAMPLRENQEVPEKEDLQEVLRHCDELERCIVLIGVSSGLGAQEISLLTVRDFERGYDEKTQVTALSLRREKTDYDFVTYLNPEATRAVNEYLAIRKRDTKSHNKYRTAQLEKQRLTKNSYLLIRRKIPKNYLKTHDEELRRLTEDAIMEIYNLLAEKANKSTPKGQWGLIRSHNVRKYFSNTLSEAGVEKIKIDFMLGHTQTDNDTAYFHSIAKTKLKDLYMNNMACLYLAESIDLDNDPFVQNLKAENKVVKRIVEDTSYEMKTTRSKLENAQTDVEKAKAEIDKLRQRLEDAENDYKGLQADKELENKARENDKEEMKRELLAEMRAMLSNSEVSMRKNMKNKPVKLSPEDEKEAEANIKEMLE
jgi:integrase